ncbi:antirestriction protein [Emticicia aquatilis]|uniref:Antirestriction protein n=1 Tax=Emticicia aquatilis TaxID=1537369 RepID=A0A917DT46_9BACT|nr:zincin-like metallopeptidase domain-containing protein [Emticicia aquatilis]GGD64247.1 antirestriction protein [Emticicia aquatilis]
MNRVSPKNKRHLSQPVSKEAQLKPDTLPQTDIYTRITNKIVSDLEKGNLTWRKPWNSDNMQGRILRPLRWNDIPYTGINTLVLWGTAAEKGYNLPYWMTFKQASDMKASVRKGEKGEQIVYADHIIKEEQQPDGQTNTSKIPFLKSYTVFNVAQIDGLPEAYYTMPPAVTTNKEQRIAALEEFFTQTKADIYTGYEASYSQSADRIQMPPFESFENAASYYAVLAHELTHWTKHPKRLDRNMGRKQYGDEGYAKEELVAELGACFLASDLGFEPMPDEKHAAYVQSWLTVLQNDKHFIFSAASHAQKAVEYIHSLQCS